MSSNTTAGNSTCAPDDDLCTVATYRLDVIVVPTVLLLTSVLTLVIMFVLAYCHRQRASALPRHRSSPPRRQTRHLQGIDAPPGLDPLEHEEVPMAVHKRAAAPKAGRSLGAFGQLTELPPTLPVAGDDGVRLYRARMDGKDVVLRVLKDSASGEEQRHFLTLASFVSGLGPHPFLPAVLGVASGPPGSPSPAPPTLMVMEDLRQRDLLGFLWRCRRADASACHLTERRLFTMATQVASALEHLHSRGCVHGNVCARSVMVGGDLTAKLWGLGAAHRRQTSSAAAAAAELKKWQAPEVLARRDFSPSADVWSFGLLLYEMITLGEAPFADVRSSELLQQLQGGKTLRRPPGCSNALFAIISSCCRWSPRRRVSVATLGERLRAGRRTADGRTLIRAAGPPDVDKYLRQAGYAEAYHYALL